MAKRQTAAPAMTPWARFLAALAKDAKLNAVVAGWEAQGCDLTRIFILAAGPASPVGAKLLAEQDRQWRRTKADYIGGLTTAIRGLDRASKAFGPELWPGGNPAGQEAEQLAEQLRQRLSRGRMSFSLKSRGASSHVNAHALAKLRAHTGGTIAEVVAVAELAVKAENPNASFSIEAAEKALRRWEKNNQAAVRVMSARGRITP